MNKTDILNKLKAAGEAVDGAVGLVTLADDRQADMDMQAGELERQRVVLIEKESALNKSADTHRGEIDKAREMEKLSREMKQGFDKQEEDLENREDELQKRLQKVGQLERDKKALNKREGRINVWEDELEVRELMVEKDKINARTKMEDLEYREKAVSIREKRIQNQINASKK